MIVDVARLDREGERLTGELPAEALELDAATGELFQPAGGLRYDLRVQLLGEELLVRGQASQQFRCLCSRCAGSFTWEARDDEIAAAVAVPPGGEAFVDLTPELRDAILLSFPSHPLCRTDCRGLCARCGADLNHGRCGCAPAPDDRWGALDALDG
ncbi:MAG: DUF177 domain-containing protein [Kiritimatiellae bacterium]|nr:DUF177 domain-containing protein [Kiritimatiellia bacterium]